MPGFPDLESRSAALTARAREVMPGGNNRTTIFTSPYSIYADSAKGCKVRDVDGTERLDFINNYKSLIHGHAHPAVVEAVTAQIAKGSAISLPTEADIKLAEHLVERVPSADQVRFMNTGTEAVMMMIKAARAFTGRAKIAKCEGCYHGTYDFAEVSLGSRPENWGDPARPAATPYAEGTPDSVLGDVVVIPFNDPENAVKILEEHSSELAGVMIDPIPVVPGCILATDEFVSALRDFCDRTGALLLFDEVVSFRLGYNGFQGNCGVMPDLTALGKIIGGGLPIGAVGGRKDIMAVFDPSSGHARISHGGTFNANPLTMVAGLAAMEAYTPAEVTRLNKLGEIARDGCAEAFRLANITGQNVTIRGHASGAGSIFMIHLTDQPITNYRENIAHRTEHATRYETLFRLMLNNGILMNPRGLCVLSTAMSENEVDLFIDALVLSLRLLNDAEKESA